MKSHTTWLITGANRGVGRGLADVVLKRPDTTLVALVRDPEHETSKSLLANQNGASNTQVLMLPYEATSKTSALDAVNKLKDTHNITALDVVVANVGALASLGPVTSVQVEQINESMAVNCLSTIMLFQATLPLLQAARSQNEGMDGAHQPKFIAISSAIGSTTLIPKYMHAQQIAYGISKAALNHAMRKAFYENPDIHLEM
jgi:norsolorinic acid ketoreductase